MALGDAGLPGARPDSAVFFNCPAAAPFFYAARGWQGASKGLAWGQHGPAGGQRPARFSFF
jgi:hypothetical protein